VNQIPKADRPISEQFRIIAKQWVEVDGAARLLEELKTSTFSQQVGEYMAENQGVAFNRAEATVKASEPWREYVEQMVHTRTQANLKKVHMEQLRMKAREMDSANFARGQEMRLSR
jgi:hypothetical protein